MPGCAGMWSLTIMLVMRFLRSVPLTKTLLGWPVSIRRSVACCLKTLPPTEAKGWLESPCRGLQAKELNNPDGMVFCCWKR